MLAMNKESKKVINKQIKEFEKEVTELNKEIDKLAVLLEQYESKHVLLILKRNEILTTINEMKEDVGE